MLTFKRALLAAATFLVALFLLTRTPRTAPIPPEKIPSQQGNIDLQPPAKNDGSSTRTGYVPTTPVSTSSSGKMPAIHSKKPKAGQQLLQDMSRAPLRDKLAYQFPYDLETKFPAYIWQTWKFTPASGEFGENFRPRSHHRSSRGALIAAPICFRTRGSRSLPRSATPCFESRLLPLPYSAGQRWHLLRH